MQNYFILNAAGVHSNQWPNKYYPGKHTFRPNKNNFKSIIPANGTLFTHYMTYKKQPIQVVRNNGTQIVIEPKIKKWLSNQSHFLGSNYPQGFAQVVEPIICDDMWSNRGVRCFNLPTLQFIEASIRHEIDMRLKSREYFSRQGYNVASHDHYLHKVVKSFVRFVSMLSGRGYQPLPKSIRTIERYSAVFPNMLGQYKKGGKVPKSGLYKLHKGEVVVPAHRVKTVDKALKKDGKKPLKKVCKDCVMTKKQLKKRKVSKK